MVDEPKGPSELEDRLRHAQNRAFNATTVSIFLAMALVCSLVALAWVAESKPAAPPPALPRVLFEGYFRGVDYDHGGKGETLPSYNEADTVQVYDAFILIKKKEEGTRFMIPMQAVRKLNFR